MKRRNLMLFNSMSMKKEPLRVVEEEVLRMFVCGPTVQSFIHVGHARTYVFYDVLARYLAHLGFRVNYLVNITDVDDRITEAARKDGVKPSDIVEKYTRSFLEDLRGLNVSSVTRFERVSNYVQVMIDQVSVLLKNGFAYLADGVVYFDTSKYPYYGKLSHQSKSELSLRPLELTPNKKNLLDFALWRPVILEEGMWDSPWGKGSPGWHIEDTAVTLTNFGPQYDIHGGAYELIYPHHEAELAQGESLTGIRPLVRYWVHTGLVNLSGRKMSKSAGNTFLVRELLREFSADELRYYLLSWHHREDVEFSLPRLKSASKAYSRAVAKAHKLRASAANTTSRVGPSADAVRRRLSPFYSAMDDDVDTPKAMEWVEEELIGGSSSDEARDYAALRVVSEVLGVDFLAKP
ncbi:MAG TPA: cysteine--tRNA ligase [Nitrososphaerales archaeon]|nr:cysteine--tRNA ligase [Nitrososphaerales archaeon]